MDDTSSWYSIPSATIGRLLLDHCPTAKVDIHHNPLTFLKHSLTDRNSLEHECLVSEWEPSSASRTQEAYILMAFGQTSFILEKAWVKRFGCWCPGWYCECPLVNVPVAARLMLLVLLLQKASYSSRRLKNGLATVLHRKSLCCAVDGQSGNNWKKLGYVCCVADWMERRYLDLLLDNRYSIRLIALALEWLFRGNDFQK